MATTLDSDVVKILVNCGCAQHVMKFEGLTIEKLSSYTRDDLARLLPADEDQEELAQKIEEEIQKVKLTPKQEGEQNEEDDEVEFLEVIIKSERAQVTIVEEIIGDDDDDDEVGQESINGQTTVREDNVQVEDMMTQEIRPSTVMKIVNLKNEDFLGANSTATQEEESSSDEDNDDEGESILLNPRSFGDGFQNLQRNNHAKVEISSGQLLGGVYQCEWSHPDQIMLKQWTDGMTKWGSNVRSLKMTKWTWSGIQSSCPWNLFQILIQQCPLIKELSIEANISRHFGDELSQFPANFRLSKLRVLKIQHRGVLDYAGQLEQILLAAHKLRSIQFSFGTLLAANSLMNSLQVCRGDQLKSLKTLSIKSDDDTSYLTKLVLIQLANVEAISLEELELGQGLWEDVDGPTIEAILDRFSTTLKKLTILGSFNGMREVKPTILIHFPSMANLETINIGGNYSYTPVYEDATPFNNNRPDKFRRGLAGQRIVDTNSTLTVEPFAVTVKFPLLPKLVTLQLGNMYNVNDLHLSTFPKLSTLEIGSRWDLSVTFPAENKSRRASYPLITRLKLPDSLDDPSFVKLIPSRFPNLECCLIYLPTVKVLRTFFRSMADSNITKLVLRTRFDFGSSLDTCLLDKPTEVMVSLDETNKIRLLKAYGWWEAFVKFHKIQLPPENLSSLEGEGLAGLSSLKNLKRLVLNHRPRILRIPKGQLHWTHPYCQFTDHLIGFRKYPWSMECEVLRNNLMENGLQDDVYLNYDNPFRATIKPELMTNWFGVQPGSSSLAGRVKEERI